MKVFRLSKPEDASSQSFDPSTVAVGYFDGVHIGHQHVIQHAIDIADEKNIKSAVMTFDPHPKSVIKQEELHDHLISTLDEKISIFESMGIDYVFVVTFSQELSKLSPEKFVEHYFIDLNVKHIIGGFDFSFGYKGKGKLENLPEYTDEPIEFSVIDKVTLGEEKVSSTYIRQAVKNGDMKTANELLGRVFSLRAPVKKGHQRGRTIGFPTANLDIDSEMLVPKVGVYAVTATVNDEHLSGMANIGFNPTFEDIHEKPSVEVYLFDFDADIYGETIEVKFHHYLRDEETFSSVDELVEQMNEDEKQTKKFFNRL
ncbi:bifunctional riboflavin kinase/FAD synthetase [Halalkalibacillus sediminis]|uniref:Riboflavin biosynthesis protein n=1 Tax=Halalkalibacillus sediminis TaxID=2018042 RepID=A0A2I0QWE3_9BACI|nr:bifunctional riboflavin kinase/FAD synthetase [Halalkalibacillus sediminis]PKR78667.1 bifunctional riboflavin kinase/FAD synthetase [Halalkalibacillus sediminis]